jgi:signal transduction histidine kinase
VLLDGALLLTATAVVDVLLGVDLVAAVLFGLANLLVGVTVRGFSAMLEQRSFWGRLPRRIANPRDLAGLGAATVAAAVASAVPGLVAVHLSSGTLTWDTTYGWVVRNACSTFVVVAAVLGLLTALFRAHARRGWDALLVPEARPHWKIELIWVAAASMLGAAVLFGSDEALPVAYLMMGASTWVGYRFSPAVGSVYILIFSTLAVLWTQSGSGPFGPIEDLTTRAIVVQIYVMVTAVLVLLLSLGASERASLHARVIESETRATSRAELLDAVMNVMTDGLVVLGRSGEVIMRNPAAEALMGPRLRPGEDGPDDYGIFRLDGSSIERDEMPHSRALHGEHVPAEDILRIDPGTGQQATLSVAALPLHRPDQDGGGTMAVVVIHDVTQERTHRRELQAFAGTVAHDLKAPLTGVGSWAEILGDQLDALDIDVSAPRSSLRRIETSAARMEQLIADLLSYSQAQSATLAPTSLSLTGMVEQVAREQREVYADVRPIIEHGPLGQAYADRTLVGQLLSNVIGNAVKYVAPGTTPHVLIGSELVGNMLEVRVADNGIGIPRGERGQIFDSFYRASSSGDYPGTGLGLAICARAVERHGGRISAREGLDGGGTTLVFTLPADLSVEPEGHRAGDTTSAEPPPRRVGSETAVR